MLHTGNLLSVFQASANFLDSRAMYRMRIPKWTFPEYTFYRNGRIPKDNSRKSIAELTFSKYNFYRKFRKNNLTHEKTKKKSKNNCKKPIREISFRQLVFGKCFRGFARFGKKYTWEMSILRKRIRDLDRERIL